MINFLLSNTDNKYYIVDDDKSNSELFQCLSLVCNEKVSQLIRLYTYTMYIDLHKYTKSSFGWYDYEETGFKSQKDTT